MIVRCRGLGFVLGCAVLSAGAASAQTPPASPAPAPAQTPPAAPAPAPVSAPESAPAAPAPPAEEAAAQPQPGDPAAPPAPGEPAPPAPALAPAPVQPAPPAPFQTYALPAPAEREAPAPPDDGKLGSHQTHFVVWAGLRSSFIAHEGFDPFAEDDVLPQTSIAAGRVLHAAGPWSLAALLGWDYGTMGATARSIDSELHTHRLWLGAEARYHVLRRLYGFARVAPALLHTIAQLDDPVGSSSREATSWVFATDLSAGAAYEVLGTARGESSKPRGWVSVDGGYGWAASSELTLFPSEGESAPTRAAALELGDLALRGPFVRASLGITF